MRGLSRVGVCAGLVLSCAAAPGAANAAACANGSSSSATRPVALTTDASAIRQQDVSRQTAVGRSSGTTTSASTSPQTLLARASAGALTGTSEAVVTTGADSATAFTSITGVDLLAFVSVPPPLVNSVVVDVSSTATATTGPGTDASVSATVTIGDTVTELTFEHPVLDVPLVGQLRLGPADASKQNGDTPAQAVAAGLIVTFDEGGSLVLGESRAAASSSGCQGATQTP